MTEAEVGTELTVLGGGALTGLKLTREDIERRVRRYYDLVDSGNHEALFELFDEDIVYERGGTAQIKGMDEFRRFYREQRTIREGKHKLESVLVDGDWACVRGSMRGTLKTGEPVSVQFADIHQFRGGKIWRRYTYFMGRTV